MTIHDWEYCYCECHIHKDILHIDSCCYTCAWCGRRIVTMYFERHQRECQKSGDKQGWKPSAFSSRQRLFLR